VQRRVTELHAVAARPQCGVDARTVAATRILGGRDPPSLITRSVRRRATKRSPSTASWLGRRAKRCRDRYSERRVRISSPTSARAARHSSRVNAPPIPNGVRCTTRMLCLLLVHVMFYRTAVSLRGCGLDRCSPASRQVVGVVAPRYRASSIAPPRQGAPCHREQPDPGPIPVTGRCGAPARYSTSGRLALLVSRTGLRFLARPCRP
jgi:hypothetical protein